MGGITPGSQQFDPFDDIELLSYEEDDNTGNAMTEEENLNHIHSMIRKSSGQVRQACMIFNTIRTSTSFVSGDQDTAWMLAEHPYVEIIRFNRMIEPTHMLKAKVYGHVFIGVPYEIVMQIGQFVWSLYCEKPETFEIYDASGDRITVAVPFPDSEPVPEPASVVVDMGTDIPIPHPSAAGAESVHNRRPIRPMDPSLMTPLLSVSSSESPGKRDKNE